MSRDLLFSTLREANLKRLPTFRNADGTLSHSKPDGSDWSLTDWMTAVTGEVGEAANLIKKLRRPDFGLDAQFVDGLKGKTPRQALADELADVVCYLDLLALQIGVDLGEAVIKKFNEISARVSSPITLRDGQSYDDYPAMVYVKDARSER